MSSYTFSDVRMMAKDIVEKIGTEKLYINNNTDYPGCLQTHFLSKVSLVIEYVKTCLEASKGLKKLYVIEDAEIDDNILGMYLNDNTKNECYIKLNANLNKCWHRFALLKEICSLYVDHYDSVSRLHKFDNYYDSLKNAFEEKNKLILNPKLDEGDLDSETFTILLATELMIPTHKRQEIKKLIDKIGTDITMYDLAKSLLIPEFVLQLYCDKKILDQFPQYEDFNL